VVDTIVREIKDRENNPRLFSAKQQFTFQLMVGIQEMKDNCEDLSQISPKSKFRA
jgi:hypothetical protein